jgi:hypothetical protein
MTNPVNGKAAEAAGEGLDQGAELVGLVAAPVHIGACLSRPMLG